jgi:wyosine [tRNA(Phe)-imidazoG37] synthetase (radical SAM superfamily)
MASTKGRAGGLVYPVLSRRSGGLSLGINLFPDAKTCSFDCPYCEVFPDAIDGGRGFQVEDLELELALFLDRDYPRLWAPAPIRDMCFSGNGEPSLSPSLESALELCARIRKSRSDLLGSSKLVLITNSTGFLDPGAGRVLGDAVDAEGLEIWAKLDGGNAASFRRMSRSDLDFDSIVRGISAFAARHRLVLQTMLCSVAGRMPAERDFDDYGALIGGLAGVGARISAVQLYTLARPSPEDSCEALSDRELLRYASILRTRAPLTVRAFGARGELELPRTDR